MNETIGERIQRLRKAKGIKQGEFAIACSVSINMVSKWENNKARPSRQSIAQIAEVLSISPAFLSYGDEFIDTEKAQSIKVRFDLLSNDNKRLVENLIENMIEIQRKAPHSNGSV